MQYALTFNTLYVRTQAQKFFHHRFIPAIQVIHALRLEGLQVPADISVMGYDNIDAAEYLDVPLTTMEQHEREIGRKAVDLLLESLAEMGEGPRPAREVVFIPRLIVRASTGPPLRGR